MQKPVILILEADATLRTRLHALAGLHDCPVRVTADAPGLLRALHHSHVGLVILGSLPTGPAAGLEIARQIRLEHRALALILLAHPSSEALAIAALKAGVNDYFPSPFDLNALQASIARWLPPSLARRHDTAGACVTDGKPHAPVMIGDSLAMRTMRASLATVAATESTVLITGETGTGKELVAQHLHSASPRRTQPLVCINCAAIPDSLLESELFGYERGAFTGAQTAKAGHLQHANGGTVFLDEIGDMSLYAQAKMLRVLDSREVMRLGSSRPLPLDVRVIAATNRDLQHLVRQDAFRADLYFRLHVAHLHLPPLRERPDDIPVLLAHYVREMAQRTGRVIEGFTDEAMAALCHYMWPGNVRELKHLVEATLLTAPAARITVADLPEALRHGQPEEPQDERERVLWALRTTNWHRNTAAQKLHWSRMTLYRKMVKYLIVRLEDAQHGQPLAPYLPVTDETVMLRRCNTGGNTSARR
jgi:DNA-binding NtrC family response regulator